MTNSRTSKTAVLATAALLIATLMTACASEPAPEWDGGGVEIDEEVPVDTTPTYELTALPDDLADELTIEFSDYINLPDEQQLALMSWAIQNRPAFAERFHLVSGLEEDILPAVSPQNSAAEITTLARYVLRIAASLESSTGGIDVELAQRTVYAQYGPGTELIAAQNVTTMAEDGEAMDVDDQATTKSWGYRFENIVSETETHEDYAGRPTKGIRMRADDGTTVYEETWTYTTFTDYLGAADAAWVMVKRERVE
jgi:hypothetical protein